jgi:RND family efflux transporter MFP subunit
VHVAAGQPVRAGDLLITLDARDLADHARQARASTVAAEQGLTQARAARAAAEAEHRLATTWQTRIAALHARSSATSQERDEAEARLTVAAAHLAGAQAAVEGADAHLAVARATVGVATTTESFAAIRAPFAGVVTERLIDPGSLAAPGVPLLRLESGGARQVVTRIDEARAAFVHTGDAVDVEIKPLNEQVSRADTISAVVTEVGRDVGAGQRAFTVKVDLPRTVTARTGSFARVVFRGAARRSLVVPAAAIRRQGQVSSVFVVRDGIASLRLIQEGVGLPEGVEVLAGVDRAESVITNGPSRLVDGARVSAGDTAPRIGGTAP